MRFAAVGIRCPEHAGEATGAARVVQRVQGRTARGPGFVARGLVALNVLVYLAQLAQGAPISGNGGSIYTSGVLYGPFVAHGDWWRLITAAFLHYGPIHLGMNMLVLWLFGPPLENVLGGGRFLLLYLVGGLAGSAGALLLTPTSGTVGASGAIFGIFGAILVLERQGTFVFGGSVVPLLVINFAFTILVPGISLGGHLGGFIGGALALLALSRFGTRKVAYSGHDLLGYAGLAAIGAISVAVALLKVRGYA